MNVKTWAAVMVDTEGNEYTHKVHFSDRAAAQAFADRLVANGRVDATGEVR